MLPATNRRRPGFRLSSPIDRAASRRELMRWAGWFATLNALVLALLALRYLAVADLPAQASGITFGAAMYLGHFISLSMLATVPLLLLVLAWPNRHVALSAGVLLAVMATLVLYVDIIVYQQYRFHLNGGVLQLVFSSAATEIFVFSWIMYLQASLLLAAMLAGQWVLARLAWRLAVRSAGRSYGYAVAAALATVFLAQNFVYAWADAVGYEPVTSQAGILPAYEPLTAKDFLARHGFEVVSEPALQRSSGGSGLNYPLEPLEAPDAPPHPNILFVVIDAWRFDAIGPRVTPEIEAFARDNLRFSRHFSGGNASRTGLFTLLYGIPGTYWHSALNSNQPPALISVLQDLNYQFGIFKSSRVTSPPFHRTVFAGIEDLRLGSDGGSPVARDRDINRDFLRFLDKRDPDRPFFSLLFYDAPHAYAVPKNAPRPFQPSLKHVNYMALGQDFDPTPLFNLYRNSVHFVDGLVGRVLDAVRAKGLLDRTIVVITGDHGQEFNDTGLNYWGHNGNYSRYQTQVPLVIHWPGKPQRAVDHLTSHFDIAPTILSQALGVGNAYRASSVGRPLLEAGDRNPLLLSSYRRYALRTESRYIVVQPYGALDVYNHRYRPISAEPRPAAMREGLELMSRFNGG